MLSPNFKNCSLSFEEAIKDTPAFRQGVILFSEELDEISKWSDSVSKTFKTYVEDYNRFNETFMSLSKKFSSNKFPCLIDPQILNPIAVSMMTFSTLQMKSLESLQETFTTNMTSIQSFLNQIKDIKETRKQMDKAMEKYDSSLLKYAGFSKTRDPSTFTEHQYSLNEFKKQYNLLAIDFVQKCMCLKLSVDPLVTSKIFPPLSEFLLFYEENLQIMNGLTTVAKEFEKSLAEESETLNVATVQSMATKWKENCIDKLARDESKGKIDSLSLTIDTALEKEGYLFRKVDQKWYRRYFSIRNGFFEAQSVKTPSMSGPLNVLLCNVKQNTTEDRRYCFEVATHSETYLLQAQSEKEMDSWIKVFENAKKHETLPDDQLEIDSSSKATSMSELQLDVKIDEADTDLRPIVQPSDKPILYADTALQKKNVELHALLKSVPPTDIVLDVFSTALQRDLLLQGKLFVTQNRLCFYSNILGFVNIVVIFLQDISDICQKVGSLHTTVTITTTTGVSYIFKAYSKVDRSFTILNIVWKNSLSENPVTPQELLDQCNFIAMDRSKTLHRFDTDKEKLLSPGLVQSPSDFIASETYSWSLPASIPVPLGPLECGCKTHLEKIENSIIVPVSVKELHETLFGSLQSEWNDFFDKQRSITNRVESAWTNDELPSQTIEFVLPVNNPMLKMKELKLYETKVYLKKEDYLVYVVEVKGTTPDAPFGDCFSTNTRYCLTWNTSDTSRLSGSTELIFCKSTMMKSIIRANAAKAMSDSFATLQSDLVTFLKQKKGSSSSATDLEWVLPDSIIPPVGEVVCGCASHLSKVESDILLQAPVSKVYETLFGSLCGPFWAAFDKKRGITRRKETWNDASPKSRIGEYWIPMNNPLLKLKEVEVKTLLSVLKSEEHICMCVELQSTTPQVPYGDCFTTEMRFCITWVSKTSCKVVISYGITFVKNTLMKSIIRSNALKGQADDVIEIAGLLHAFIENKPDNIVTDISSNVPLSNRITTSNTANTESSILQTLVDNIPNVFSGKSFYLLVMLLSLFILRLLSPIYISLSVCKFKNYVNLGWELELDSLPPAQKQKFNVFLDMHFQKDDHHDLSPMNDAVSYTSRHTQEKYVNYIHTYQWLSEAKQDLSNMKSELQKAENHLLWAMYMNWREDHIDTCQNNTRCLEKLK